VELRVVRRTEVADALLLERDRLELDRQQVFLGELVPGELEPVALLPVRLVRDRRTDHPVGDLLAVDGRLQLRLDRGGALRVLAGQVPEVALAGELPELAHPAVAIHRGADAVRPLERRQLGELLVDRLEVERVLEACVVQVVLVVDRGDEAVRLLAVGVQLALGEDVGHPGSPRIPACSGSTSAPSGRRSSSTSRSRCSRRSTERTALQLLWSTCRTPPPA
jgi:hypothetical protein